MERGRHCKRRSPLRWCAAALLLCAAAAVGPQDLFYIYDGRAAREVTAGVLRCFEDHGGLPPWQDSYILAELMTELWMHRSLLDHPLRTTDPSRARYFYIPGYFEISYKGGRRCHHENYMMRSEALVAELRRSPYFRRFGGTDHFTVCLSFHCRRIFSGADFDTLTRVTVGNLEPGTSFWHTWGCHNKVVAVPYSARTDLTLEAARKPPSERPTTLFFHGSSRGRPERINLEAAAQVANRTDISEPVAVAVETIKLDDSYVDRILQSRFCFAPRGDTPSSRRLFDAIAAGCIPIAQYMLQAQKDLPFPNIVPYNDFTILAPDSEFATREGVMNLTSRVLSLSEVVVEAMHASLLRWRPYLVVAKSNANTVISFEALNASPQLGAAFYEEAVAVMRTWPYKCTLPPFNPIEKSIFNQEWDGKFTSDRIIAERRQRLVASTFPKAGHADEWDFHNTTKADHQRKLVFCAVPGAGGGPLEAALARAGVAWEPLRANWNDSQPLRMAYTPQYVQINVVREPLVRLLSLFLEQERGKSQAELAQGHGEPGSEGSSEADAFKQLVARLAQHKSAGTLDGEGAFRPQSGFCGARYRPFAAELPAEQLDHDGPLLLGFLDLPAASDHNEDSGSGLDAAALWQEGLAAFATSRGGTADAAAAELLRECRWTEYLDGATLALAVKVYAEDYERTPYYKPQRWTRELERCAKERAALVP